MSGHFQAFDPQPEPVLANLRAVVAQLDPAAPGLRAQRLYQGRSNHVFRLDGEAGGLVCKFYDPAAATPLFANRPDDEATVLGHLAGSDLAPVPVATGLAGETRFLVYRWVEEGPVAPPAGAVGAALRRVHDHASPAGFPEATLEQATAQCQAMLAALDDATARRLSALRPAHAVNAAAAPVLLHGDPVPGNLLQRPDGRLCLIDWQCPAAGDPLFDLALYLSPAMQIVHGGRSLTPAEVAAFWCAYGPEERGRYDVAAGFFHWRMALYCAWRAARGDAAYRLGEAAEIEALDGL